MSNKRYPLVSIVIPCYNSESYITNCINSILLHQDYPNIEIVVVDDGSSDNSYDILKGIEQREQNVRVLKQNNSGACVARNKGLAHSSGEYIKFLDSDDTLLPDVIKKQVEIAELPVHKNQIIYGDFYIAKNNRYKYINTSLNNSYQTANLFFKDILTSTSLHRRWMLERVEGFDERFKNGQEWNLHIRLSSEGFFFQHIDLPIYNYCIHDSEHRISVKSSKNKSKLEYVLKKLEMTNERLGENCKGKVDSALARNYWDIGRRAYRSGHKLLADECISKAKSISNDYSLYFPNYYKVLYSFLGFKLTEELLKLIYKFKKNHYL